jgi:hypothetical protein
MKPTWFICPTCGFRTTDGEMSAECQRLGTPPVKLAPGNRVSAYGGGSFGTVSEETRVIRANRGNHSPSHVRRYLINFDSRHSKWLSEKALTLVRL